MKLMTREGAEWPRQPCASWLAIDPEARQQDLIAQTGTVTESGTGGHEAVREVLSAKYAAWSLIHTLGFHYNELEVPIL
jgi:hypothetical protein